MQRPDRRPGTPIPENVPYILAVTEEWAERFLIRPRTAVEAGALLRVISNPKFRLALDTGYHGKMAKVPRKDLPVPTNKRRLAWQAGLARTPSECQPAQWCASRNPLLAQAGQLARINLTGKGLKTAMGGNADPFAVDAERNSGWRPGLLFPAMVCLVSFVAAGRSAAAAAGDFSWQGRLQPGQVIEIAGVGGSVHARPTQGGTVKVLARAQGERNEAGAVEFAVVRHARGVTICAVYPAGSEPGRGCAPGVIPGGPAGAPEVNFDVRVPAGIGFIGRTVNGGVVADALQGDVEAHTVNGPVRLSTSAGARATTVNGPIEAILTGKSRPAELRTVNGAITLRLPEEAQATLEAETVNGRIVADFPVEHEEMHPAERAQGHLNGGGQRLMIKTVNGDIRLMKEAY